MVQRIATIATVVLLTSLTMPSVAAGDALAGASGDLSKLPALLHEVRQQAEPLAASGVLSAQTMAEIVALDEGTLPYSHLLQAHEDVVKDLAKAASIPDSVLLSLREARGGTSVVNCSVAISSVCDTLTSESGYATDCAECSAQFGEDCADCAFVCFFDGPAACAICLGVAGGYYAYCRYVHMCNDAASTIGLAGGPSSLMP